MPISDWASLPSGTTWDWESSRIVIRFIRRLAPGSNAVRRCIVKPLSPQDEVADLPMVRVDELLAGNAFVYLIQQDNT